MRDRGRGAPRHRPGDLPRVPFGDGHLRHPDEVLSGNGKQFTGRFGKPRPAEVLVERICRRNGIRQLLTKPYSPTTTGKVERWHQTLPDEFLEVHGPFGSIAEAQAAVDAWPQEYNTARPHQSRDMATPAERFRPARPPTAMH